MKQTINSLDTRLTRVEVQLEERWKEAILRIKRIEAVMIGAAASIIAMLAAILTKMS
jgi:hypothetical protein